MSSPPSPPSSSSTAQFQRKYVDSRQAARTWRPSSGTMSPGLKRARAPFRIPNAITGIILGAFVAGVYTYSIRAVRQDDFGDIDDEAKAQRQAERLEKLKKDSGTVLTVGEEKDVMARAAEAVAKDINVTTLGAASDETSSLRVSGVGLEAKESRRRGILVGILEKTAPGALDPANKTLVWGAPDADNIGKAFSKK
ncbi:hypothetical protein D9757_001164 [Collybiopsis confluens]|uniref:Cytochrome c oxidase assembly factor 3 n=1 Tax=Collybiopsis confluens TaxID=2823264 RepID=A0A8H5I0N3_9AGAR|nr:hypothetical protein D9757_001164 [Collybiopsis confluens]